MLLKNLLKRLYHKLPVSLSCLVLSMRMKGKVNIAKGSYIHPSVHILGSSNVSVGQNSCVSEGSWLNVNHRLENQVSIDIGNDCFIGKQNFFTSGDKIVIGDYTLTTIGCRFIGSSHHIEDPLKPYLMTGTTSKDSIIIGVNCFIGAGATILGHVKIGHGSVVGATSLVLSDIPPFSVAVGNPSKVVKRYSFRRKEWISASSFSDEDEVLIPTEESYLKELKQSSPRPSMPWIAAGKSLGDL